MAARQQQEAEAPQKQAYVPPSLRNRQATNAPAKTSLNETTTMKKITPSSVLQKQEQNEEKRRQAASQPPTPEQQVKALRGELQQIRRALKQINDEKATDPSNPDLRAKEQQLRNDESRVISGLHRLGVRP